MKNSKHKKGNRKLSGFFVRPRLQIRMFFLVAGLGQLLLSAVFMVYLYFINFVMHSALDGTGSEEVMVSFQKSLFWVILLTVSGTIAVLSGSLIFFVIFTQRVLGPTIPIIRLIEQLKGGHYGAQKQLRNKDELKDVMQALNELSQELARRHPNVNKGRKPQ